MSVGRPPERLVERVVGAYGCPGHWARTHWHSGLTTGGGAAVDSGGRLPVHV